ncbi:GTP pyrophosphokinase [Aerococcaceae bacterium NML190073]|nr:GTP pyrophosphokinase [Aerococcaceae bacterium NML190073]
MLKLALKIAEKAHAGQVDKAGKDYIQHPIYVSSLVDSPEAKVIALLHDVLEDSDYTAEDLLNAGLPCEIVEAVKILTKQPSESYDEYLSKIKMNDLARVVKIADLTHNADLTRLHEVTQRDLDRQEKYREAIMFLAMADE